MSSADQTGNYSARETLAGDLMEGEDVLWAGQPDHRVLFAPADRFLVPFSLLWGGFAVFWETSVILSLLNGEERSGNGGSLWFFVLFGIPFVLMGLYLIAGRFLYKRYKKKRTLYAVTNRRVMELTRAFGRRLNASFIYQLPAIGKSESDQGMGTIRFGNAPFLAQDYSNTGLDFFGNVGSLPVTFFDIRDVGYVYNLVNQMMDEQAKRLSQ